MRKSRLRDPLRRPLFRRLATTYAVNELGDWMGIVALSVLVFERTGSALAMTALFLGTRFLPALLPRCSSPGSSSRRRASRCR